MKGAIFDLDGTLLDSMGLWATASSSFLCSLGIEPEADVDAQVDDLCLEDTAKYLIAHYPIARSVSEVMELINLHIEQQYFDTLLEKAGVRAFLERLKSCGISMCVATATDHYQVEAALKRLGLLAYFSGIFTCTQVGAGKQSPAVYELARKHLNLQPDEIAVFEDALYAVKTAKAAGYFVVGIADDYNTQNQPVLRELCDLFIDSWYDPKLKVLME